MRWPSLNSVHQNVSRKRKAKCFSFFCPLALRSQVGTYNKESPLPFIKSNFWSSVITTCPAVPLAQFFPCWRMMLPSSKYVRQKQCTAERNKTDSEEIQSKALCANKKEAGMEIESGKICRLLFVFLKQRLFRLFFYFSGTCEPISYQRSRSQTT